MMAGVFLFHMVTHAHTGEKGNGTRIYLRAAHVHNKPGCEVKKKRNKVKPAKHTAVRDVISVRDGDGGDHSFSSERESVSLRQTTNFHWQQVK